MAFALGFTVMSRCTNGLSPNHSGNYRPPDKEFRSVLSNRFHNRLDSILDSLLLTSPEPPLLEKLPFLITSLRGQ
jgi:hypothetical protein